MGMYKIKKLTNSRNYLWEYFSCIASSHLLRLLAFGKRTCPVVDYDHIEYILIHSAVGEIFIVVILSICPIAANELGPTGELVLHRPG